MTEIVIAKAAKVLAGSSLGMMPVVAAIDISTQTALVGLASLGITSLTAIALAWIALKQNELRKKQDEQSKKQDEIAAKQDGMAVVVEDVKKQTDGITSALVNKTAIASRAEGIAEGQKIATAEAALVAKGKLEGSVDGKNTPLQPPS